MKTGLFATRNPGTITRLLCMNWTHSSAGYTFEWNLTDDVAVLSRTADQARVWTGSLLPGFLMGAEQAFVKARCTGAKPGAGGGELMLELPGHGTGSLRIGLTSAGFAIEELRFTWAGDTPRIAAMYFGARKLDIAGWTEEPFFPDWQCEHFCIPSGRGAPIQSFFRFFDLGNAHLALGSFGPNGVPYAAAYPRPLYGAGFGDEAGWLVAGPGAVPDGALYLKVQSGAACQQWLYREDLWGAPEGSERVWEQPMRFSWHAEAWEAYLAHFSTFPTEPVSAKHQRSSWNSWGEYKLDILDNKALITAIAENVRADLFTVDDKWETANSTGLVNRERFPDFEGDLAFARERGMDIGLWQSVSWMADPQAAGLEESDLVPGRDGKPCQANWLMSPYLDHRPVLDPSSARTRAFIREKTLRLVRDFGAQLLKVDFGYGIPDPNAAAPRDPAYRGERLAYMLYKLMADAAREADPDITIQSWGLSPLLRPTFNLLALDDLGDAGSHEAAGHRQWSVWAALAGANGTAIMASGGYDWEEDADILLNTAVIGSPGGMTPFHPKAGPPPPAQGVAKRRALSLWFRRSVQWKPLWLNTEKGRPGHDPLARCWGRLEGDSLTALALRDGKDKAPDRQAIRDTDWEGRWALIAQGEGDIFTGEKLACIPFDAGWLKLAADKAPREIRVVTGFDEKPWTTWEWKDGFVCLEAKNLPAEFTGFLVLRQGSARG